MKGKMPKVPIFQIVKKIGAWNKGKKIPQLSGENHFAWKGDNVSYRSLHKWVQGILGKPHKCDECEKPLYDTDNISGLI